MNRFLIYVIFLMIAVSSFLSGSCEKQEYDLFPLQAGNRFYFTYYKYRLNMLPSYTNGNEVWTVISVTSNEDSYVYKIERRMNGVAQIPGQTIIYSDSLRYFDITEDKSSSVISFSSVYQYSGISFKRHQPDPLFEIKQEGNTSSPSWSYVFRADSGLTQYTYYHPPNQVTNESLHLDSVRILR